MNYEFEQHLITNSLEIGDFSAFRTGGELHAPAMKALQVAAAFTGSLVLMVGVDFGVKQVLPTLIASGAVAPAALLLNLATLVLCALAVTNAVGKSEPASLLGRPEEGTVKAILAGFLLAAPGLGGTFLAASGVAAVAGVLPGAMVGFLALLATGFTVWLGADPEPALSGVLTRRSRPVSEVTPG